MAKTLAQKRQAEKKRKAAEAAEGGNQRDASEQPLNTSTEQTKNPAAQPAFDDNRSTKSKKPRSDANKPANGGMKAGASAKNDKQVNKVVTSNTTAAAPQSPLNASPLPVLLPPTSNVNTGADQKNKRGRPKKNVNSGNQGQHARNRQDSVQEDGSETHGAAVDDDVEVGAMNAQPEAAEKKLKKGKARAGNRAQPEARTANANHSGAMVMGRISAAKLHGAPRSHTVSWQEDKQRTDVKSGAFSTAEQQAIRAAIQKFADERSLDTENMEWIFNTRKKGIKGAITDIAAAACPDRKRDSVWSWISRNLRPREKQGKWDSDELELLRALVSSHGHSWTAVAQQLGRTPEDCRLTWRSVGGHHSASIQKGRWTEEECSKLKELIDESTQTKDAAQQVQEEIEAEAREQERLGGVSGSDANRLRLTRKAGNQWILDKVDWDWVASHMKTRTAVQCRTKWYRDLCPSMIDKGDWGHGDDKTLLRALHRGSYEYEYQVPWSDMVPGRTAAAARRRWLLMLRAVPERADKELRQQVGWLVAEFLEGGGLRDENGNPMRTPKKRPASGGAARTRSKRDAQDDGDQEEEADGEEEQEQEEGAARKKAKTDKPKKKPKKQQPESQSEASAWSEDEEGSEEDEGNKPGKAARITRPVRPGKGKVATEPSSSPSGTSDDDDNHDDDYSPSVEKKGGDDDDKINETIKDHKAAAPTRDTDGAQGKKGGKQSQKAAIAAPKAKPSAPSIAADASKAVAAAAAGGGDQASGQVDKQTKPPQKQQAQKEQQQKQPQGGAKANKPQGPQVNQGSAHSMKGTSQQEEEEEEEAAQVKKKQITQIQPANTARTNNAKVQDKQAAPEQKVGPQAKTGRAPDTTASDKADAGQVTRKQQKAGQVPTAAAMNGAAQPVSAPQAAPTGVRVAASAQQPGVTSHAHHNVQNTLLTRVRDTMGKQIQESLKNKAAGGDAAAPPQPRSAAAVAAEATAPAAPAAAEANTVIDNHAALPVRQVPTAVAAAGVASDSTSSSESDSGSSSDDESSDDDDDFALAEKLSKKGINFTRLLAQVPVLQGSNNGRVNGPAAGQQVPQAGSSSDDDESSSESSDE